MTDLFVLIAQALPINQQSLDDAGDGLNLSTSYSSAMQRRIVVSDRPYWITTHDLSGEWYAVGDFNGEVVTVAAGNEAEVIRLWREAAEAPGGRGGLPVHFEPE